MMSSWGVEHQPVTQGGWNMVVCFRFSQNPKGMSSKVSKLCFPRVSLWRFGVSIWWFRILRTFCGSIQFFSGNSAGDIFWMVTLKEPRNLETTHHNSSVFLTQHIEPEYRWKKKHVFPRWVYQQKHTTTGVTFGFVSIQQLLRFFEVLLPNLDVQVGFVIFWGLWKQNIWKKTDFKVQFD